MIERKIGERFVVGYDLWQTFDTPEGKCACESCHLYTNNKCQKFFWSDKFGPCAGLYRKDHRQVYFQMIQR